MIGYGQEIDYRGKEDERRTEEECKELGEEEYSIRYNIIQYNTIRQTLTHTNQESRTNTNTQLKTQEHDTDTYQNTNTRKHQNS